MMSEIECWPADWVDESCPPSKKRPEDFAFFDGEHWQLGYAPVDNEQAYGEILNQDLSPGDVVNFITCERLGEIEITFRRDGTYELHGTVPQAHNAVMVDGDVDTLQDSYEKLIKAFVARPIDDDHISHLIIPDGVDEHLCEMDFADWSDPVAGLFEVEDGKPVFRPVPAEKN